MPSPLKCQKNKDNLKDTLLWNTWQESGRNTQRIGEATNVVFTSTDSRKDRPDALDSFPAAPGIDTLNNDTGREHIRAGGN